MSIAEQFEVAESRTKGFRDSVLATKGVGSGGPYGETSPASSLLNSGTLTAEKKQYEAAKQGIPYTAIRPICTTIAKQPIHVGKKALRGGTSRRMDPRKIQTKSMPEFVRKAVAEGLEVDPQHELLDVFESPNPCMVGWALKYCTAFSILATGKAFIYLEKLDSNLADGKRSMNLWYLPSTWVKPVHEKGKPFTAFKVTPPGATDGDSFTIPADQMAYIPFPDPENPLGVMSPVQSQSKAINTDDRVQEAQQASMINGQKPGMVITAGRLPPKPGETGLGPRPNLTPEQRSQLVSAIRLAYSGTTHYGDPIILDAMIEDVYPYTASPQEMDFLSSSSLTKERVMQGIGTNPIVVGQVEGANRASSYVAHEGFYTVAVNPVITLISEVLTEKVGKLMLQSDTEKLYVWIEEAKAFDADLQIQQVIAMNAACAVTPNEIREMFGLPPIPGGDELPAVAPPQGPPEAKPQRPGQQKLFEEILCERLESIEGRLKAYDPDQHRTTSGQWSGGVLDAGDVLRRIQKSPNHVDQEIDWERYAVRWGVSGTFYQTSADAALLDSLLESGALGISRDLSESTILDKMETGVFNPAIIARPPNERSPLFVLDGSHSLVGAIRNWKADLAAGVEPRKSVKVIVSGEAAAFLSMEVQKAFEQPVVKKIGVRSEPAIEEGQGADLLKD